MRNITLYGARGNFGSFERAVHLRAVHLKEPFKRLALFYTVKVNGSLQRAVQSRSLQGAVQKSRLVHAEVCNQVLNERVEKERGTDLFKRNLP